jgi:hypothetical protein
MENIEMFADLAIDALELELCSISSRLSASMCQFLLAVAEYDRRRGWERWECHDMGGWLSWKCGIAPVTAREQVRVARALEHLPLVTERFSSGRLSYSQVRAITRVATPTNESSLIDLAGASTAAQLERICRSYRRTSEAAKETEDRRDAGRYLRFAYDDDGCLVGTFRLPAEAGAVFAAAINRRADREAIAEADRDRARDPFSAAQADALVELVAAGVDAPDTDEDSQYLVTVIVEESVLTKEGTDEGCSLVEEAGREPGVCQLEDGPGLAAETVRRLACNAAIINVVEDESGNVLDVGRRMRLPNRALRRALRRRDGHCQVPGCNRRRFQPHHVWHWIKGGPTNLDNLVALCGRHHRRVHEGGYRIQRDPDGRIRFVHPNGWVLPSVAPIGPADDRAEPDVEPYESGWDGTRLHLGDVIDGLLQEDGLIEPASRRASAEASSNEDREARREPVFSGVAPGRA